MPLTIDLPPETLAALRASAGEHGRTPADEAAVLLADVLADQPSPASGDPPGPVDWSGDPLAAALLQKIERLRDDPDAFSGGATDPFVAALAAERAGGAPSRDAA